MLGACVTVSAADGDRSALEVTTPSGESSSTASLLAWPGGSEAVVRRSWVRPHSRQGPGAGVFRHRDPLLGAVWCQADRGGARVAEGIDPLWMVWGRLWAVADRYG